MWTVAARLSRRRTWHNSCVRIASSWPFVSVEAKPSGSTSTGRKMPNTPGSRAPCEMASRTPLRGLKRTNASNSRPPVTVRAPRTIAATRSQRATCRASTSKQPAPQIATSRVAIQPLPGSAEGGSAAETNSSPEETISRNSSGADCHETCAPRAAIHANGTRNFRDAAVHMR